MVGQLVNWGTEAEGGGGNLRGGGVTAFLPLSQTSLIAFAPPNPSCTPSWGTTAYPEWEISALCFPVGVLGRIFPPSTRVCSLPTLKFPNSAPPLKSPSHSRGAKGNPLLFVYFFRVGGRRGGGGKSFPAAPMSPPCPCLCPRPRSVSPRSPSVSHPLGIHLLSLVPGILGDFSSIFGVWGGARRVLAVPPGKVGGNVIPWLLAGLGGTRGQGGGQRGPPVGT